MASTQINPTRMLAQLLQENDLNSEISSLQQLVNELRSNCAQLEESCASLTAEVCGHLCKNHHVEGGTASPLNTPATHHPPVMQVPTTDPLLVSLESFASWQRDGGASAVLPYVFGSAEYLQDPDCGLGGLNSSTCGWVGGAQRWWGFVQGNVVVCATKECIHTPTQHTHRT